MKGRYYEMRCKVVYGSVVYGSVVYGSVLQKIVYYKR